MRGILNDRYAEALLSFAFSRREVQEYAEYLEVMSRVIGENSVITKFMADPRIEPEAKGNVFEGLAEEGSFSVYFVNFLKILTENGRLRALPAIMKRYLLLARDYYEILTITIETPVELTDEQINEIKQKCAERFNVDRVRETVILNESLIGGVKVIAGSAVIDNSIKKQLEDIEKLMNE
jgi:F-type H+-transporting ATPase subunit delta